jgi:hypothetical protein
METKFIEDTNEQYSIREDGNVIKHYKKQRISNTITIDIETNNIIKVLKGNCIDIHFNGKAKRLSISNLLTEYFGYSICNQCSNKFIPNISPVKCDCCRDTNRNISSNNYGKKATTELTRNYIANTLNISIDKLTDDLYYHHKSLLELKRKIAKEHNLSIYKLK